MAGPDFSQLHAKKFRFRVLPVAQQCQSLVCRPNLCMYLAKNYSAVRLFRQKLTPISRYNH
ncbi:hypothetical protein N7516_001204 [Penicillium verrucosum]|uniref:uncharacterized protein n=1 Tax=Penicillium verrucosum TaxID=60171 RepID=UPI0025456498|nr:uncharacterized protein N7516_001204 [Penicillium verrucosum]KAJ5941036.1 hypothetical protein N7516_001204 [Penicillium verrucosum]